MDLSLLFSVCSAFVIPFWALLIFAPRGEWTQRLVHSALAPALLGCVYLALVATSPPSAEGAGFSSLEGVTRLFALPHAVLAGWVHYLAFDLFVGAWEARDARRHELPHLAVVPCLLLTFMLGPLGLLLYLALRGALRRRSTLAEL
jgi:hypothetical protein